MCYKEARKEAVALSLAASAAGGYVKGPAGVATEAIGINVIIDNVSVHTIEAGFLWTKGIHRWRPMHPVPGQIKHRDDVMYGRKYRLRRMYRSLVSLTCKVVCNVGVDEATMTFDTLWSKSVRQYYYLGTNVPKDEHTLSESIAIHSNITGHSREIDTSGFPEKLMWVPREVVFNGE